MGKITGKPGPDPKVKKPVKKKAKKRMGRPSKFGGVDLKQVEKLARKGFTDAELSEFFSVTEQTWNNWKKKHAKFFESLKDWKLQADENVVRSLYERATGYEHMEDKVFNANGTPLVVPTIKHYAPDSTAAIFWLKNRQPAKWRDKMDHGIDVDDDKVSWEIKIMKEK